MIVDEDTTCRISQGTPLADLISKASLVIWDEAPMEHMNVFEMVNKTFKDIIGYIDPDAKRKVFGARRLYWVVILDKYCQWLSEVAEKILLLHLSIGLKLYGKIAKFLS
ncbi:UNVERIFIED_CONTAM: hypothetical protein Slati_1467300 [Sesamum latifolium]|uniref:ATP-dependent DNA helicase n=1 Tax=Sesamum latifolium TaxID=2727402 RepID=A0AAW2X5H5_9LAMI